MEAAGNKNVHGVYASEWITIGFTDNADAIVHSGTFGLANIVPADVLGGKASGVIGFGFGDHADGKNRDGIPTILEYAFDQELITERSINLWLGSSKGDCDGDNGGAGALPPNGVLTWGGPDQWRCNGEINGNLNDDRSLNMSGYRVNGNETLTQTSVSYTISKLRMRTKTCSFVDNFLISNVRFIYENICKNIQKYKRFI